MSFLTTYFYNLKLTKDSLLIKFIFKVFSGIISIFSAFVVQTLFIKKAGIGEYGIYSYIFTYLSQLIVLADFGISNFFYTHTVNYFNRRKRILLNYIFLNLLTFLVILFSFIIIYYLQIFKFELFAGSNFLYFLIILFIVFLNKLILIFSLYNDSIGNTSKSELNILFSRLFSLIPFFILYYFENLTLLGFIIWLFFQSLIILYSIIPLKNIKLNINLGLNFKTNFFVFLKLSKSYSIPLLISSIIAFLINFFDRYIVLKNGNSSLQGYFNFSFQLSNLIIFITSSLVFLLIRDFTLSNKLSINSLREKFSNYTSFLFYITVSFSVFFIFNIKFLIIYFLNNDFGFYNLIFIFFLYPIHQILGQLGSGLLISTNQTKVFLTSSIYLISLSFLFYTLFYYQIIKIKNVAEFIACKIIFLNFVITFYQLKKVYEFLKLDFKLFIIEHTKVIFSLFMIGYFFFKFFTFSEIFFINFIIATILFFFSVFILAYYFNKHFGLKHTILKNLKL